MIPAVAAAQTGWMTKSDSAKIYYRVIGHGADTIIAIHGGPGMDQESIYADFVPLAARHTVIFYDQRGGGKSELDRHHEACRHAPDSGSDELRRHFGISKVTLIAHSYGPLLAASYAIAHPNSVKNMVFFGPVPRRGNFFQRYGANINARF